MKIAILLPYKENFSPEYPGAVSLFVNETSKISKYKKDIIVFGNTNFKKKYNLKYLNINLIKNPLISQTKKYVSKFARIQKKYNISLIEVHNRPSYIFHLAKHVLWKFACQSSKFFCQPNAALQTFSKPFCAFKMQRVALAVCIAKFNAMSWRYHWKNSFFKSISTRTFFTRTFVRWASPDAHWWQKLFQSFDWHGLFLGRIDQRISENFST